jgi:carboxylesterase
MPQPAHLSPDPFFLAGGPTGVLLLHGFTGSPPEMRLVGDYLHDRGLTVQAPCLPGHGTNPDDLNAHTWRDMLAAAEAALAELQALCPVVFVGGLSMGALLTVCLAAAHPELAGIMTYSPALRSRNAQIYLSPFLKHVAPIIGKPAHRLGDGSQTAGRIWCYDVDPVAAAHELLKLQAQARRLLPRVACPLLVVYSLGDRTIRHDSGPVLYARVASTDKQSLVLEHSGHCITVDGEWQQVAEASWQFILRHLPADSLAPTCA